MAEPTSLRSRFLKMARLKSLAGQGGQASVRGYCPEVEISLVFAPLVKAALHQATWKASRLDRPKPL